MTVTRIPGHPEALVQVSTKHHTRGWDEWEALVPRIRVSIDGEPRSALDALDMLRDALDIAERRLRDE